ncbi:flagellar hook-associated protein FlgK [Photobacterium aquimaris]|uniref:Flagellar hook-associated protein 1 n=1 Tax=Photobacterium aquimaris TaxID=512643 RepID=A0A2T3I2F9_9GAMM|nr:flagellar hook-associated protein FlgK [Photobacterium aquimaris]MCP4956094.1 flagellar hook-associated protein FlgK [Photobacterium aquimaris]OBU24310.1 flagellar hook-associated protein FlgK [Photobacterium aquimaris]PQJ40501.1 flagellar hook-associated protein FlgK [Photobacterium aquimaris]PSU12474.1 flagellar hook-associated protein FlgK [Photobacterium aquimaris]
MAVDLMQIGVSGLRTSQKQLDVASHNITNVNTPGYSRQVVEQKADNAHWNGNNYYGTGAYIDNVSRAYDQFAARELTLSTTQLEEANVKQQHLAMLDDFTSKSAVNSVNSINDFYHSVRSLADNPSDLGSRQTVLEHANQAAVNLNNAHETLTNIRTDVNQQLDVSLERVNALGQELAAVNTSLQQQSNSDGSNDLFDQQRTLINELAKYTQVTVLADKGSLANTVIIGSGDTLVSGVSASQLKLVDGDPDVANKQIALINGNNSKPIKSDTIGGSLGAMLTVRDDVIDKSLDQLGQMAIGFGSQMNDLQQQGVDLNGQQGQALFNDINSAKAMSQRALKPFGSSSDISVKIDDINQLKLGDYQLVSDASSHTLIDQQGNKTQLEAGADGKFVAKVDGLEIIINQPPTLTAGETETTIIQPSRRGAADISLAMTDPRGLAGHRQLTAIAAESNTGSASITKAENVPDDAAGRYQLQLNAAGDQVTVTDLKTNTNVELVDNRYSAADGANIAFKTSATTSIPVMTISANAAANDSFKIELGAQNAQGGNGNFLAMQQVQHQKTMADGKSSVIDVFEGLATDIGMLKKNADKLTEVNQLDFDSASERVSNLSGVNLDEEAANLMKFQQSYMASSRIMSVAKETFDTLMRAV